MVLKNVFLEPLKRIQVEGFAMFAEPQLLFGNLDELCSVSLFFFFKFFLLTKKKDFFSFRKSFFQNLSLSLSPKSCFFSPFSGFLFVVVVVR